MMIKHSLRATLASLAALLLLAGAAPAQEPLVHLAFDAGNTNSGTAGGPVYALNPPGTDGIRISAGKIGQGASFGKGGGFAVQHHFDQSVTPQATVTLWLKVETTDPYERELVSLGPGNGLLVTVTGQRKIAVRSYAIATNETAFPLNEWVFVAATVNNLAKTIRIQVNDDVYEATGLNIREPVSYSVGYDYLALPRNHFVFIGADDFNSAAREMKPISLDDVRLHPAALTPRQIDAIRNAAPASEPVAGPTTEASRTSGGTLAQLPEDITQPLPDVTLEPATSETSTEPSASGASAPAIVTVPVERTPDDGLTKPDDLPGDILEEDLQVTERLPPPEAANELFCETASGSAVQFSATASSFPADFIAALSKAQSCNLDLNVATVNRKGEWIVATADQIAHSKTLSAPLLASLASAEQKHGGLDAADIAESGAFVLAAGRDIYESGLSADARRGVQRAVGSGGGLRFFDFHPTDPAKWALVDNSGSVSGGKLPSGVLRALADLPVTKRNVHALRLGSNDDFALLASGSWVITSGIGAQTMTQLGRLQDSGRRLDHIVFAENTDRYALYSAMTEAAAFSDSVTKIEQDFRFTAGGVRQTAPIWARIKAHNLKAVSIAMVRNNRIEWARAYGVRDARDPESYAFTDTTFDAASISKPIASLGLLQLVEQGKLSLTEEGVLQDIEALIPKGKRGKFRREVTPEAGNLIQLLQHCQSLCYAEPGNCMVSGNGGGAAEYAVSSEIPTTAEMIVGKSPALSSHSVVRTMPPGLRSEYTTANFMLVQALIDVHGGGFLSHMEPLLAGMEMTSSTYRSPYPKRADGNYARGWEGGKVSDFAAYGEMAGASLVSTPTDIAKFIATINRLAEDRSANGLVTYDMIQKFLGRDVSIYESSDYRTCIDPNWFGTPRGWGLGVGHDTSAGNGWNGNELFSHGGTHNGYRNIMVGLPTQQSGLVVFMTGSRADGDRFFNELTNAVIREYGF